ncbi:MAG TPA: GPP34 family phosphoprotein [Protaetiibacter sp.]|nr:GPP34 family phosphoprotein [Protaetiibacter sp.]
MNDITGEPGRSGQAADDCLTGERLVAEDLMLLLFQPESGSIAGEGTLYYVLAGAVLAELGLEDVVRTATSRIGTSTVEAREGTRPNDALLRRAWDYVDGRPRGLQSILAAVGPTLREPVLERLIARGDIRRVRRKMLGVIPTSSLVEGASGRRDDLLAEVRAVLVDGVQATPRIASLAALLYASGTLPQFDPVIPWGSRVITRAEELTAGEWGATAAANAVARTLTVLIINSVIYANGTSRSR